MTLALLVAAARVAEQRLRESGSLARMGRAVLAVAARRSSDARDFVRLRVMRML